MRILPVRYRYFVIIIIIMIAVAGAVAAAAVICVRDLLFISGFNDGEVKQR